LHVLPGAEVTPLFLRRRDIQQASDLPNVEECVKTTIGLSCVVAYLKWALPL